MKTRSTVLIIALVAAILVPSQRVRQAVLQMVKLDLKRLSDAQATT